MDRKRKARTFPPVGFQLHLWTKNSTHASSPGSRKQIRWVAGQEALCPGLVTRRPLQVQRDEREHPQQWNGAQS